MSCQFNSRISSISESSSMKRGLEVEGSINLAIGAPDISPPKEINELLSEFITNPNWRYFSSKGSIKALKNILEVLKLGAIDPFKNLSLSSGSKFAIYNTLQTICDAEDNVLILSPYWLSYPSISKILGLNSIYEDVKDIHLFEYDLDSIQQKIINNNIKALIINTPNNPTGKIIEIEHLKDIISICNRNNCWVIIDEVYKDLSYKQINYTGFNQKNIIRIGSLSKSLSLPGARVGYVVGSEEFIYNFNLLNQHISTCISSLSNFLCEEISPIVFDNYTKMVSEIYKLRVDKVSKLLVEKGYEVVIPDSSFYLFVKITSTFQNDEEAVSKLEEKGIIVNKGSEYGDVYNNYIRLCLTQSIENIYTALNEVL